MDRQMYHYATVSKALQELADKGFTIDYNLQEQRLVDNSSDFEIVEIYRYEGETDPGDEATVYGIKSNDGEKGVYVSGYMAYEENPAARILHEISIRGRENNN